MERKSKTGMVISVCCIVWGVLYFLFLLHLYYERNIEHPAVIIDCNHANSDKQYLEQIRISKGMIINYRQCFCFERFALKLDIFEI